jgi:hypothetical protein
VGPLLGLVVVTLLLSMLTAYGAIVGHPRYLLPLYLAPPVLLGVAFQRLGRRWPAAMWILVGAIALNNLLGSLVESPVLFPSPHCP